ncbi:MAG: hypothetical protein ACRYFX_15810 [Janthinobacterium lividum]
MNAFTKLFAKLFSSPPPPPAPAPPKPPNWLDVEGQRIDLNTLSPAELANLETHLTALRQQRQGELARYLHDLAAERERLLAARSFRQWLMTLNMMFGETIGQHLAIQHVVPGMQLQHLILSFGEPDQITATSTGGVAFIYGNAQTGSYFEVAGDLITQAHIIGIPNPPQFDDVGGQIG